MHVSCCYRDVNFYKSNAGEIFIKLYCVSQLMSVNYGSSEGAVSLLSVSD